MKYLLFSFLFIMPLPVIAQSAIIYDVKVAVKYPTGIMFPIIQSEIKEVDDKINRILRDTLLLQNKFMNGYELPLKKLVDSCIGFGMSLGYDINFNRNGLLCLQFFYEITRGSDELQLCLNFDLQDGHLISLREILNPGREKSFYDTIYKIKREQIDDWINERRYERDEIYKAAIDLLESCRNNSSKQTFYLSSVEMVVIDECGPELEFVISKNEMAYYIKPEIYRKLFE